MFKPNLYKWLFVAFSHVPTTSINSSTRLGSTFLEGGTQQQNIYKWGRECSKPLVACHKIFGFPGKDAWKKFQRYSHQMVFFHGDSGPPSNSIHLPCSSWNPSVAHYQIVIIHYYQEKSAWDQAAIQSVNGHSKIQWCVQSKNIESQKLKAQAREHKSLPCMGPTYCCQPSS